MVFLCIGFMVVLFYLFAFNNHHLLNCLIFLESVVLLRYYSLCHLQDSSSATQTSMLAFFVLSVGSSALGLSILVIISRIHGQDSFLTYNLVF